MITLTWGRQISVFQDKSLERAVFKSLRMAGGDAARFLKAGSSRLLRQRKRMRVRFVNESLPLQFPRNAKTIDGLEWRMNVSGEPVAVGAFSARQTKKGVSVTINTGRRTLIKSAFIATMKSGHTGVFLREGKARKPIRHALTSRISDVFRDSDFVPFVQEGAQVRFASSFERLFKIELVKLGQRK